MAKTEMGGQIGPFIILLAILGGIVFYVITVSPAERERMIGPVTYERYALNVEPGLVTGMPASPLKMSHELGVVDLDFSPISNPKSLSQQLIVSRSILIDKPAIFSVSVAKTELSSASLDFTVLNRHGSSEVIVLLNDVVIFTGLLDAGTQSVELPSDQLLDGTNKIVISVNSPGAAFWRTTDYTLGDINFVANNYNPAKATMQQVLTLNQQEVLGLVSARFDGYVKQLGSKPATLSLSLNGKPIYAAALVNTSISLDLPPSLVQATNNLGWSVDRGGKYEIVFGRVTTEYVKNSYSVKSYSFMLTSSEIQSIKGGQLNCVLDVLSGSTTSAAQSQQPSNYIVDLHIGEDIFGSEQQANTTGPTQVLTFQINSQKIDVQMTNGVAQQDVCKYLMSGDNYLAVYSPSDIQLGQVSVLIKGKT